jgi:uncharacterized protein (DUF433 family)
MTIVSVPGVCGGEPVIEGTRITCSLLYHLRFKLAKSAFEIQVDYPLLELEEIEEAIAYALKHPEIVKDDE